MATIGKQRRSEERSDISLAQGDRIASSEVRSLPGSVDSLAVAAVKDFSYVCCSVCR